MGEEQKKAEEPKQPEVEVKKEEKTEEAPKPAEENKENKKAEDEKSAKEPPKEAEVPLPPPPPQEIVLKIYMHCEGCAKKVRRCLKGFHGVEAVETDCKTHTVVVKGDKADPLKVLERLEKKRKGKVELISPIPKPPPPPELSKKPEETEVPKTQEKIPEPQKITAILHVQMHCEACAQAIRKRILRIKGVESVEADLKSSLVKVEGAIEAQSLVEFIYKKTAKQAEIVKVDEHKKEEGEKPKEEEPKGDKKEEVEAEAKGDVGEGGEKNKGAEGGDVEANGDGGEKTPSVDAPPPVKPREIAMPPQEEGIVDLRRNEFYYYPPQNYYHPPPQNYYYQQAPHQEYYYQQQQQQLQPTYYNRRYAQEMYAHPPQIFSDENPNACSLM